MIRPLLCAALFLAAAPTAFAQTVGEVVVHAPAPNKPGVEVKSETVKVSDLNLRKAGSTSILYKRITDAAEHVCSPAPVNSNVLSDSANHKKCVHDAVASAVKAVNNKHLTARWNAAQKG